MWTDRVDVFVATQSRVNHGPGGSSSGFLPVERCAKQIFHFPSASFLKIVVRTKTSSFGVPLYSNFALATEHAYAISTPTSTILTSSNSPPLFTTPRRVIISSNIFEFIGFPEGRMMHSPVFVHVFARSVGQRGENRANLSFIRIRGRHDSRGIYSRVKTRSRLAETVAFDAKAFARERRRSNVREGGRRES